MDLSLPPPPPSPSNATFRTPLHDLSDTLKVYWTLPAFTSLSCQPISSPLFHCPADEGQEFWLQLSSVLDASTRTRAASLSCQEVACLHLHRRSSSPADVTLKYLLGLGGPSGTLKVLTQVLRAHARATTFDSQLHTNRTASLPLRGKGSAEEWCSGRSC